MVQDKRWHTIIAALMMVGLATLACGPLGGGETPTPTLTLPHPPEGRCGDGVCDEAEQANPALCPQDCLEVPGGEPPPGGEAPPDTTVTATPTRGAPAQATATPTATPSPGRARLKLQWTSSYGDCQADSHHAEMEFTLSLTEDGGLTGSGQGTMGAEGVARCPDTDYGGHRTPAPYPVTVKGAVTTSGWMVELVARDASEFYFTSGQVYQNECRLCWLLPQYKGLGVSGSLSNFSLPRELRAGDTFRFVLDYQIGEGHHVGEGALEIVEVPH
jgi:hypothetical protein